MKVVFIIWAISWFFVGLMTFSVSRGAIESVAGLAISAIQESVAGLAFINSILGFGFYATLAAIENATNKMSGMPPPKKQTNTNYDPSYDELGNPVTKKSG